MTIRVRTATPPSLAHLSCNQHQSLGSFRCGGARSACSSMCHRRNRGIRLPWKADQTGLGAFDERRSGRLCVSRSSLRLKWSSPTSAKRWSRMVIISMSSWQETLHSGMRDFLTLNSDGRMYGDRCTPGFLLQFLVRMSTRSDRWHGSRAYEGPCPVAAYCRSAISVPLPGMSCSPGAIATRHTPPYRLGLPACVVKSMSWRSASCATRAKRCGIKVSSVALLRDPVRSCVQIYAEATLHLGMAVWPGQMKQNCTCDTRELLLACGKA